MRTWWDLKWKKNVCNQFCASFSSYPSYLRCSTHNSTIMWCFLKEKHCESSVRNSQNAIFMQIALCAKLRNFRTTENIGNVGRMHLKCKSFLRVVNSSLRSLLPKPFRSFSLWLRREKNNNYQTEKIVCSCYTKELLSRSDNGAKDAPRLPCWLRWKSRWQQCPNPFSSFWAGKKRVPSFLDGFLFQILWHLLTCPYACAGDAPKERLRDVNFPVKGSPPLHELLWQASVGASILEGNASPWNAKASSWNRVWDE